MANSMDPDQTAPTGAVCFGSTLFASILNLSVMLGNYLQQTTSADVIFRCIFFSWCFNLRSLPTPGRFFFQKIDFFHFLIFCSTSYYKKNNAF